MRRTFGVLLVLCFFSSLNAAAQSPDIVATASQTKSEEALNNIRSLSAEEQNGAALYSLNLVLKSPEKRVQALNILEILAEQADNHMAQGMLAFLYGGGKETPLPQDKKSTFYWALRAYNHPEVDSADRIRYARVLYLLNQTKYADKIKAIAKEIIEDPKATDAQKKIAAEMQTRISKPRAKNVYDGYCLLIKPQPSEKIEVQDMNEDLRMFSLKLQGREDVKPELKALAKKALGREQFGFNTSELVELAGYCGSLDKVLKPPYKDELSSFCSAVVFMKIVRDTDKFAAEKGDVWAMGNYSSCLLADGRYPEAYEWSSKALKTDRWQKSAYVEALKNVHEQAAAKLTQTERQTIDDKLAAPKPN